MLQAQGEGMRQRQDAHAIRERLEQVEHRLAASQAENRCLQQENVDLLALVKSAEGGREAAVSSGTGRSVDADDPTSGKDMQPGRDDEQGPAQELEQAGKLIKDLSEQKAFLENLVHELRRDTLDDHEMVQQHGSAPGDDEDPRVFGLQASVVALNASLLSYQQDLREMQYQLDAERLLSSDLEYVIRSALAEQAELATAQDHSAAKVWSDETRLRFDKVISDLRIDSKREKKQGRGGTNGGRRILDTAAADRRGVSSTDAQDQKGRKTEACGFDVRQGGAASCARPGHQDSSQESSSGCGEEDAATGWREQKLKMQLVVASVEWAVVRARVSWEELVRI